MRKVLLTVMSLLLVLFFTTTGFYGRWYQEHILRSLGNMLFTGYMDLGPEERRSATYGPSYRVCRLIADEMRRHPVDQPLLLLPPPRYLQARKMPFELPEPAVFYYYTGFRSTYVNSPDARKANYAVIIQQRRLQVVLIDTKQKQDILFRLFRLF